MGREVLYGAYDTRNNEEVVIIGTAKELSKYFNMTIASLHCAVSRQQNLRKRYEVLRLEKEEQWELKD